MEIDEKILESFLNVLPYMKYFFEDDISVAVTDREKFLGAYEDGKLRVNTVPGEAIPEGGAAEVVLKSGEPAIRDVPAHVYGVPFRSYAVPVMGENGDIVGAVLLAKSIELSNQVKNLTSGTMNKTKDLEENAQNILGQMEELLSLNTTILEKAKEIKEKSDNTKQILVTMQTVVRQSNLLGLNASIEAARVGEAGKGFAVVAKRMEELSQSTSDSIEMVKNVISDSLMPVEDINELIQTYNEIFEIQTKELEDMQQAVMDIAEEVQDLVKILSHF